MWGLSTTFSHVATPATFRGACKKGRASGKEWGDVSGNTVQSQCCMMVCGISDWEKEWRLNEDNLIIRIQ